MRSFLFFFHFSCHKLWTIVNLDLFGTLRDLRLASFLDDPISSLKAHVSFQRRIGELSFLVYNIIEQVKSLILIVARSSFQKRLLFYSNCFLDYWDKIWTLADMNFIVNPWRKQRFQELLLSLTVLSRCLVVFSLVMFYFFSHFFLTSTRISWTWPTFCESLLELFRFHEFDCFEVLLGFILCSISFSKRRFSFRKSLIFKILGWFKCFDNWTLIIFHFWNDA